MKAKRRVAKKRLARRHYGVLALLFGCSVYGGGEDGQNPNGAPGSTNGAGNGSLGGVMECWYSAESGTLPAATVEYVFEVKNGQSQLHLRLTFALVFVDNTYGVNSIGWGKRGHTFVDLVRSDHAEIILSDGSGTPRLQFKMDYISEDASAPSGYASLGVQGGDGSMIAGDPSHIVQVMTSLDNNLNALGYADYTVDSPPTDENYTPSAEAPAWEYRVQYDAWIDEAAFGSAGFGDVSLEYVHASPSKVSSDTWLVFKGDCPPIWIPGGNDTGAGGGPGSGSGGSSGSTGSGSGAGGSTDSGAGGSTDSGASGSGGSVDTGASGSTGSGFIIPTGAGGTDSGASSSSGGIDSGAVGSSGTDTGAGGGPSSCDFGSCTVHADCANGYGCWASCCYPIPE